MEVVFSIAQQIAVLHQGRADRRRARRTEVRSDREVRRVYLGRAQH